MNDLQDIYSHKVRVRVCGLLIHKNKLLLLKHLGLGNSGFLWSPPGGGLEFGEDPRDRLRKEFLEETNLHVAVGEFFFLNNFCSEKLHAIELFFKVTYESGVAQLGFDPEIGPENQILEELRWFESKEMINTPNRYLHNVLHQIERLKDLDQLKSFHQFMDISAI